MKKISFTQEEKAKLFDEIADHFYNRNFGQFPKADMELLMFKFYIEKLIRQNEREDGSIDYQLCSDYRISNDLGITQQKVRSLKVKKQLIYPVQFSWEKALAYLTQNARFDRASNKIVLNIPDPNLYLEIQNFIEEKGAHVEKQLNGKVLQIRIEYYIDLLIALEGEDNRKKIIAQLAKELKQSGKSEGILDEKNIGRSILGITTDIASIVGTIAPMIVSHPEIWTSLQQLIA